MENKPIYRRIADSIIDSIQKGGIVQDTKLPSIRKLAKEYDVSNLTALNAMRLLEDERIVYAMPKKGYFVRSTLLSFDGDNVSNEKEQLYSLLAS